MEEISLYSVSLEPLDDISVLESEWLDLENRSNCSFFLSWTWIGAWLSTFKPDCHVLKVYFREEIVALALVTRSRFSAFGRFSSSRIHFHQKGDSVSDQIWTEYNGILSMGCHHEASLVASMRYLQESFPDWDELVIGAVTQEDAALLERASGLERRDLWQSSTYGVDLLKVARNHSGYLGALSGNARYQIRRSLKLYHSLGGGLKLNHAGNDTEALKYLEEVAPLHLDRWGRELYQSGFSNDRFVAFHQALIKRGFSKGQIDFIKVTNGDRVIGYIYNFLYRTTAYFYLSGLCAESDSKLKPGLCSHALCIQHYLDSGFKYYDFMGGDERYKASLGEKKEELYQIALQKRRLKFKVEKFLRKLKKMIYKS